MRPISRLWPTHWLAFPVRGGQVRWTLDEPARSAAPFDVVVGSGALTLGSAQIAALLPQVAGGLLILAEPGPSRLWSLVWPDHARQFT